MNKRKFGETPITEAQVALLERLRDELPAGLEGVAPLLDGIRESYKKTLPPPKLPTRQATDFRCTVEAAHALGIEYKHNSIEHLYTLKETTHSNAKELSPHFAAVIKDLNSSDYVGTRHDESFSRTILDLILVDRLRHLEDKDTFYQLILSAEVPVSVKIRIDGKTELVKGRADWALGYGKDKANTGSVLIVVEAKPCNSASIGMPQMLVYMAAVQEARLGHTNKSVFGMLSDSKEFRFAFLDSDKKFYESLPLVWICQQQAIISYIDAMLLDAIQSSPHTTPTKIQNNTLLRYRRYLEGKWVFGEDVEDEIETEAEMDEDVLVDVVNVDGCIVLRTAKRPSM